MLDTDTYVATVTPVLADPAVQDAVAQRLANEIVTRTDLTGIANKVAERLVAEGAPPAVTALVDPLVNGLNSFLYNRIRPLLATEQVQAVWRQVNTLAHQAVVTVLTGAEGTYLNSTGDTVTLDLGAVLETVKQKLVEQGLTFVERIPEISIPFTVVQSDKLPELRTYTRVLDAVATWLPWVVLALAIAGVLAAPNRRRGIITGAIMLGVVAALLCSGPPSPGRTTRTTCRRPCRRRPPSPSSTPCCGSWCPRCRRCSWRSASSCSSRCGGAPARRRSSPGAGPTGAWTRSARSSPARAAGPWSRAAPWRPPGTSSTC
ncbi:hypothetical protein ACFQX7_15685 [Luedemannella flava]